MFLSSQVVTAELSTGIVTPLGCITAWAAPLPESNAHDSAKAFSCFLSISSGAVFGILDLSGTAAC